MKYISDDMKENFLKKSSFTMLGTLYPAELLELIMTVFKARKGEHNKDRY